MIDLELNGRDMELVGWGKTETRKYSIIFFFGYSFYNFVFEKESFSSILLKADITGHPKTSCKGIYQNQEIDIQSYQICGLGNSGGDACHGDGYIFAYI